MKVPLLPRPRRSLDSRSSMSKCLTMSCRREAMEGSHHCPHCTLYVEKEYGRAGFYMHGRDPSPLYARALEELERERRERSL